MISEWFYKKLSYIAGLLSVLVLFGLIIFAANIEIKDTDLWLHIATGRYMAAHQEIPKVDVLSFTKAGQPWENHEWLFQVLVFRLYDAFGPDGLIGLQVALITLTFLILLFLGYRKDYQLIPVFLLFLVLWVYQLRFTIRPDLFSVFFLILYVILISGPIRFATLLWIFLLQALWANTHGFFILGPAILLLSVASEWIKRHIRLPFEWNNVQRSEDQEYRLLIIAFVVACAACLFNPLGLKGALYPLKILFSVAGGGSKVLFDYIMELKPPIQWSNLLVWNVQPAYKALIAISALSFFANLRKFNIGTFLFWLVFLLFSLKALRNIPFFAVAAYFVILNNLQDFSFKAWIPARWNAIKVESIFSAVAKGALIIWMASVIEASSMRGYFNFDTFERKSEYGGVSLRNYPYQAVDFLEKNKITGRFFNDFNAGAYLLGRLHPQWRVFIDGRTEVFGNDFVEDYRKIKDGDIARFNTATEKYNITGAFLSSVFTMFPGDLASYLSRHPDWKIVYFDYDGVIFLRDIDENSRWIRDLSLDLSQWNVAQVDLEKIGLRPITPYRNLFRAETLYYLGYYDKAVQEAQEAIRLAPNYPDAYMVIGRVSLKRGEYDKALEVFRQAKILESGNMEIRYYLAQTYYHLGKMDQAKKQCERILEGNPKNALGLYLMSLLLTQEGAFEASYEYFKKALGLLPYKEEQVEAVIQAYLDQGQGDFAKKALAEAMQAYSSYETFSNLKEKLE